MSHAALSPADSNRSLTDIHSRLAHTLPNDLRVLLRHSKSPGPLFADIKALPADRPLAPLPKRARHDQTPKIPGVVPVYAIAETKHDYGFTVTIHTGPNKVDNIECFFAPQGVLMANNTTEILHLSQNRLPSRAEPGEVVSLDQGLWFVHQNLGGHAPVELLVLPATPPKLLSQVLHDPHSSSSPDQHLAVKRPVSAVSDGQPFEMVAEGEVLRLSNKYGDTVENRKLVYERQGFSRIFTTRRYGGAVAAVKVIYMPASTKEQITVKKNFRSEVQIHLQVSQGCRNIVKLLEWDPRYMVMYLQYVDGPCLADRRGDDHRCSLSKEQATSVLAQLATAIDWVHGHNISHNDVRPANVLTEDVRGRASAQAAIRALLCDFGLARAPSTLTGGSPFYLPPEYLTRKTRGKEGDMWAVGVVALWMYGAVALPERTVTAWPLSDLYSPNPAHRQFATDAMNAWVNKLEAAVTKVTGGGNANVRGLLSDVGARLNSSDLKAALCHVPSIV